MQLLEQYNTLLTDLQEVTVKYLVPDGLSADEYISSVILLVDGPYQRAIQYKYSGIMADLTYEGR